MNQNQKGDNDYSFMVFKPGTPMKERRKGLIFFTILTLIVISQACYWIFANSVEPILMGMPFGMFTVVLLTVLEFITLLVMFLMESKPAHNNMEEKS